MKIHRLYRELHLVLVSVTLQKTPLKLANH
jgi:hypothetical protein